MIEYFLSHKLSRQFKEGEGIKFFMLKKFVSAHSHHNVFDNEIV